MPKMFTVYDGILANVFILSPLFIKSAFFFDRSLWNSLGNDISQKAHDDG